MAKYYIERKRGNKKEIFALVVYRDSSGNRRQIWRRANSKTEAKNIADQLRRELNDFGPQAFEQRMTLNDYLDKWLANIKHKIHEKTYDTYKYLLRMHVRPSLGKKELQKIKPLDVQEMINKAQERGLSAKTVREARMMLSRALKQAIRWKITTSNSAQDVELPKIQKKEMQCLSPEQAKVFLDIASKDKWGLLFELALYSGMRPEEYLALKWPDIDLKNGTATVNRVVYRRRKGGGWYFKEPKTKQSRRTIPLPLSLVEDLVEYKKLHNEERLKNHDLVFPSEAGTPLSIRNLERRHFKPILQRAGLPDIRLYDLRHSCATLLLAAGENPKVVSERLGHASIVLTLDTYSHVLPSMQKSATEKLEMILKR